MEHWRDAAADSLGYRVTEIGLYRSPHGAHIMHTRGRSNGGLDMPRQIVRTKKAAKAPSTYSQAVRAAGLVFVSGTGPFDPV